MKIDLGMLLRYFIGFVLLWSAVYYDRPDGYSFPFTGLDFWIVNTFLVIGALFINYKNK